MLGENRFEGLPQLKPYRGRYRGIRRFYFLAVSALLRDIEIQFIWKEVEVRQSKSNSRVSASIIRVNLGSFLD